MKHYDDSTGTDKRKGFWRRGWRFANPVSSALTALCILVALLLMFDFLKSNFLELYIALLSQKVVEAALFCGALAVFGIVILLVMMRLGAALYYSLTNDSTQDKFPKIVRATLAVLFCPLAGWFIMPELLQRKRRFYVACALVSGIFGAVTLLEMWVLDNAYLLGNMGYLYFMLWLAPLLIAISGLRKDAQKNQWYFWFFLTLVVVLTAGRFPLELIMQNQIAQMRAEYGRIFNREFTYEAAIERENQGTKLDSEPLTTLIAEFSGIEMPLNDEFISMRDYGEFAAEIDRRHPAWIKALNEFVALQPDVIGHGTDKTGFFRMTFPELSPLRNGMKYYCALLIANAGDRDKVLDYHDKIRRLQEWLILDRGLLAKMVALETEELRIHALSYALAFGSLSDEDWQMIMASKPDWPLIFAEGLADEVVAYEFTVPESRFKDYYENLGVGAFNQPHLIWRMPYNLGLSHLYLIRLYQCRNYYQKNLQLIELIQNRELSGDERTRRAVADSAKLEKTWGNSLIVLLAAGTDRAVNIPYRAEEANLRLNTAIAIMKYYRLNNQTWPENLEFLEEIPLDYEYHTPLVYKTLSREMWEFEEPEIGDEIRSIIYRDYGTARRNDIADDDEDEAYETEDIEDTEDAEEPDEDENVLVINLPDNSSSDGFMLTSEDDSRFDRLGKKALKVMPPKPIQ